MLNITSKNPEEFNEPDLRLIHSQEADSLIGKIIEMTGNKEKDLQILLHSWWQGEMRWARNRVNLSSDRRDINLIVARRIDGIWGPGVSTNQIDDKSLKGLIDAAARVAILRRLNVPKSFTVTRPILPMPDTYVWSDNTLDVTYKMRGELAAGLSEGAEKLDLLSAGYIEMRGGTVADYSQQSYQESPVIHQKYSQSQCSMTVRHPLGTGSGWVGKSSYDWATISPATLAKVALDKCVSSLNPVAIEPGRYTVVLEPKATADLLSPLVSHLNGRIIAEMGRGPFVLDFDESLRLFRTKLGIKVVDERVNIGQIPTKLDMGILSEPGLTPVQWIKDGVLTDMSYARNSYSLPQLNQNTGLIVRSSYEMSGGEHSVSDLIEDTKRGILVSRIWGVSILDGSSVLCTGVTRDGLWLIENGKISKAIKNFRITESPLFVLNQIDKLGRAEPVFHPVTSPYSSALAPVIVPSIKARDFSFTSLVDAI